jgi:hypothetical protein
MIKKKQLYEDVVVGGTIPVKQSDRQNTRPPTSSTSGQEAKGPKATAPDKESDPNSSESNAGQESKKSGKDEQSQPSLEARAEKLSEEPFATDMEELMGGDTKQDSAEANDKEKNPQEELEILAERSDKILFHAKSIFPFDFFPNTVTIDANKVNIIIKTFFFTETVTSILLKEIMDVRVESTLFLGKLIIDYGPHPLKINTVYVPSMWKKDALRAKEIIEGTLVLYRSENINTTELKPEETLQEVKEVGKIDDEHRPD